MKVVVVGGGFSGIGLILSLARDPSIQIVLIDNKPTFFNKLSTTRLLTEPNILRDNILAYDDIFKDFSNVIIKYGWVHSVSLENSLALQVDSPMGFSMENVGFDYLVLATGCSIPKRLSADNCFAIDQMNEENLSRFQLELTKNSEISVIGGGPCGVEIALNLSKLEKSIRIVHSREVLLDNHPISTQEKLKEELNYHPNISVERHLSPDVNLLELKGIVIQCAGFKPNSHMMKENFSQYLDEKGYIKVDNKFRVGLTNIFAIGDVCDYNEEGFKLATNAFIHGGVVSHVLSSINRGVQDNSTKPNKMENQFCILIGENSCISSGLPIVGCSTLRILAFKKWKMIGNCKFITKMVNEINQ